MRGKRQIAADLRNHIEWLDEQLKSRMDAHVQDRSRKWNESEVGETFQQRIDTVEDAISDLGDVAEFLEE